MKNEKRLIDANEIKYHTVGAGGWSQPEKVAYDYEIDKIPTVEAVEVVHGRWNFDEECWVNICSNCRKTTGTCRTFPYCPNCGAKMDGEKKDSNLLFADMEEIIDATD